MGFVICSGFCVSLLSQPHIQMQSWIHTQVSDTKIQTTTLKDLFHALGVQRIVKSLIFYPTLKVASEPAHFIDVANTSF